jgi:hypothetical protein
MWRGARKRGCPSAVSRCNLRHPLRCFSAVLMSPIVPVWNHWP